MKVTYFIRTFPYSHNFVKIGNTSLKSLKNRFSGIQTGCPYPLYIYAVIGSEISPEKAVHKAFKHNRIRGEWFVWEDLMYDFVKNCGVVPNDPFGSWGGRFGTRDIELTKGVRNEGESEVV